MVKIRVSTVNPRFARGNFVAKPKYRNRFQVGYGVAMLNKAGTKWTALDVGSAFVGCIEVRAGAGARGSKGRLPLGGH